MTAPFAVALALTLTLAHLTHKPKRKMSPLGIPDDGELGGQQPFEAETEPILANNKTTSFCIILPRERRRESRCHVLCAIYLCQPEKS